MSTGARTRATRRVAIDCRTLQDRPPGGVGRSLVHLLEHLAGKVTVDVLLDSRRPEPAQLPENVSAHWLTGPITGRGFAWLQAAVPLWLRDYDGVFHCPFYGLPYRQPVPMVVTIHDLVFEFAPRWQPLERTFVFRRQARWAARTARRIIVHSEHVRSMLLERYDRFGASEQKVVLTQFPVDPCFIPEPPGMTSVLARLGLRQPYVVALGGASRRQLGVAVAAWADALKQLGASGAEMPLAVVGTEPPDAHDGVMYAGALSDREWASVLAGAAAFCYATCYEGYGVPALEAAACATPVVCARVGALPELLGDTAAWAEAPEREPLGSALARILADRGHAAELAARARGRVSLLPSWAQVAAVTLEAYDAAAR